MTFGGEAKGGEKSDRFRKIEGKRSILAGNLAGQPGRGRKAESGRIKQLNATIGGIPFVERGGDAGKGSGREK